jgi:uncharacterized protein YkwD
VGITRKKTNIMRQSPRTALNRIALVATFLTAFTALVPSAAQATTLTPQTRMYQATNNSRLNNGVHKAYIHYTMSSLARQHSIKMANRGYIFHTSKSVIQGTYLKGVNWSTWGENVGVAPGTIGGIEQAFMKSPDHRANILNSRFRRVAVGTYRDANGYLWVTVFFYG